MSRIGQHSSSHARASDSCGLTNCHLLVSSVLTDARQSDIHCVHKKCPPKHVAITSTNLHRVK